MRLSLPFKDGRRWQDERTGGGVPRSDGALSVDAEELARDSRARNTRVAYGVDWRSWLEYLEGREPRQAHDHDLANYAAVLVTEGRSPATIRRRISGVRAGYGPYRLVMQAGPEIGLPFGTVPRLLLA